MERRLADLPAQVRELRAEVRGLRSELGSQFRWLLGTFISTFIIFFGVVMGAMARRFGRL